MRKQIILDLKNMPMFRFNILKSTHKCICSLLKAKYAPNIKGNFRFFKIKRSTQVNCGRNVSSRLLVSSLAAAAAFKLEEKHDPDALTDEAKLNVDLQIPHDEELIHTLKHAVVAWQFNELENALELFHDALKIIALRREEGIFTDIQVHRCRAYVLSHLANLNGDMGQPETAERLFVAMMQEALASGVDKSDESLVECSLKLANLFAAQGHHSKARSGYSFCLEAQGQRVAKLNKDGETESEINSRALLGIVESSYGAYLLTNSKPVAALPHLYHALKLAHQVYGAHHLNCVSLLSDIGTAYLSAGRPHTALHYHQTALDIVQNLTDNEDSHRIEEMKATLMINLGRVFLSLGDFAAAVRECKEGGNIARNASIDISQQEAELCIKQATSRTKD